MIVPGGGHIVDGADQLIAVCLARLDQLNQAIQQRQWKRSAQLAQDYSTLLGQIDQFAQNEHTTAELIQLDIRHRRCIRKLRAQMARVSEDLESLENGKKHIEHSRRAATSLFQ